MRLFLDQNLSRRLIALIESEYPETMHAVEAGLLNADDIEIWNFASQNNLIVVSKDSDFRHLSLTYGPPPKVIWLRVGNGGTVRVAELLNAHIAEVRDFATDPDAALLVLA